MKINDVNIATWSARQSTMSFAPTKYTNASTWQAGAAVPSLFGGIVGFKTLTLNLIVKGIDRADILENVSDIVAACKDKVTISLDRYPRKFTGYLTSASNEELSKKRFHRLNLQFNGYEHGDVETVSGTASLRIYNPGNLPSPAKIVLSPSQAIASVTLTGLCQDSYTGEDLPVTVKNLVKNQAVYLDGINGSINSGGLPREADIWRLPYLMPGWTDITCNSNYVTVGIECLPLYA